MSRWCNTIELTKQALARAPFLRFPDFSRPFHMATDASNTGVGGVLYQPTEADGDALLLPTLLRYAPRSYHSANGTTQHTRRSCMELCIVYDSSIRSSGVVPMWCCIPIISH